MSNKKQKDVLEIVIFSIGLLVGCLAFIFGLITCSVESSYFTEIQWDARFGADFYTYSYDATKTAANNLVVVADFCEAIKQALGVILIVAGLLIILVCIKNIVTACRKVEKQAEAPSSQTHIAPVVSNEAFESYEE